MNRLNNLTAIAIGLALALDLFVWYSIIYEKPISRAHLYFLDVGQGDASLLRLPGDIRILTDAGPPGKIPRTLEAVDLGNRRYIDLGVITHPQLDHYGGFRDLLERYTFGAILINGRQADPGTDGPWKELLQKIDAQRVPLVTVTGGDNIAIGENHIRFLSPNREFLESAELNDTGLVELMDIPDFQALLAADIGDAVEHYLTGEYDLRLPILKVPHHGSKYSSSAEFLNAIQPKLAVIEVGERNRYGHPAPETLARLAAAGAKVLRTDQNGTVDVSAESNILRVVSER